MKQIFLFGRAAVPIAAALSLWVSAACGPRPDVASGVQLVISTATLEPSTTFEVRFDQPIVEARDVGLPAAVSPLVVKPPIEGRFRWLTARSGVFTPSAAMQLGHAYRFRLRDGLTDDSGKAVTAQLDRTLLAPAFSVVALEPQSFRESRMPAQPELRLQFNAPLAAAAAQSFIEFRSPDGGTVPARVTQGTVAQVINSWNRGIGFSPLTWDEQFAAATNASPAVQEEIVISDGAAASRPNLLIVTPQRPLPVGSNWSLVVARGVVSTDRRHRTSAEWSTTLGDVEPFKLAACVPENSLRAGRRIEVHFTKPLDPAVHATNASQWFTIIPSPEGLRFEVNGDLVVIRGDFAINREYALRIARGLPAAEIPFQLASDFTNRLSFAPVAPRLYLPAFDTVQLSSGRREIELLAVNVNAVRLRARQLDRHTLVHALRGYRKYFKEWNQEDRDDEPHREVDFDVVPGRFLGERVIRLTNEVDTAQQVKLRWDDLLEGETHGAVFLSAAVDGAGGFEVTNSIRRLGAQCLMQVTDLGLHWKVDAGGVTAFVFSQNSGAPIRGAAVRLARDDNQTVSEAVTDAQGFARLVGTTDAEWLLAELNGDLHAERLFTGWQNQYGFGFDADGAIGPERDGQILLFSDRPVYRPGDTLHLKTIVRSWQTSGLVIPSGLKGTLRCFDPLEEKIVETNLTFSSLATAELALPLPERGRGSYRVELSIGERRAGHSFRVEDYEPELFEVKIAAQPAYAAGEQVRLPVSARYLMGRPVSRARVRWDALVSRHEFAPSGFEDFRFGTQVNDDRLLPTMPTESRSGESNLVGQASLVIDPGLALPAQGPLEVHFSAAVTDISQKTVRRSAQFIQHSAAFYLGLKLFPEVLRAGEAIPLQVVAVGADGTPRVEPTKLTAILRRVEWNTVRVLRAGLVPGYRSDVSVTNLSSLELITWRVRSSTNGWIVEPPESAPPSMIPPLPGQYLLELSSSDDSGNPVKTVVSFVVSGKDAVAWNYGNPTRIQIQPDREHYTPGDTARLLIKSPLSGRAVVSVEREQVRRIFVAPVEGNAAEIQVPIEAGDAPNVYVSVTVLRGAADSRADYPTPEYRYGYCQLRVENPASRLAVVMDAGSEDRRPGEPVAITAEVRDSGAHPVADAEVTLYAVDEGVLNLTGYDTPEPHKFFFQPRPLGVRSHLSLPNLFPEDPADWRFGNKGFLVGGGGYDAVRKNFLALAFWNAALRTGADGRVTARFPAPDSLTRYRVIAVVVSGADRFGSAEARFRVNKPLMLEPALPRFANIGDRLVVRGVVHNQTPNAGEVEVTLRLDPTATSAGTAHADGETDAGLSLTRRVSVSAAGAAHVEFPLVFVQAGQAKWLWRARFVEPVVAGTSGSNALARASRASFTDSVQSTLEVGYPVPLMREIHQSRSDSSRMDLLAAVNPQLRAGQGRVVIRIANTRLNELGGAADHLLHYPYGCVEQTSSSLLPWIILRRAPAIAPQLTNSPAEFARAIRGGVARLFSMQTESGGLSYWPGGNEPMLWGSAYGGMVLAMAQRQGAVLSASKSDKLWNYLRERARGGGSASESESLADRSLACYALALAGRAEPAIHEQLFNRRAQLSAAARAWLVLAIAESKGPSSMMAELLDESRVPPRGDDDWFGSEVTDVALRLLASLKGTPNDAAIERLVTELLRSRKDAHWSTTQGNAWGLLALSEYAINIESAPRPASGRLRWGAEEIPFSLGEHPAVFECSLTNQPALAAQSLWLENPSGTRLFTTVTVEVRPSVWQQPRQDHGFSLARRYVRLDDDGAETSGTWRVGDRILVELSLEANRPAHYVAIDDALPAVLEGLNPAFQSQSAQPTKGVTDWFSDHREMRTDRVLFFRNHLPSGRHVIRYVARVRAAGEAIAPSAKVEAMYQPDRFGLSETVSVKGEAWE